MVVRRGVWFSHVLYVVVRCGVWLQVAMCGCECAVMCGCMWRCVIVFGFVGLCVCVWLCVVECGCVCGFVRFCVVACVV